MKKRIGIFILTYDRLDNIKRLLNRLNLYTNKNQKIFIFADNAKKRSIKVKNVHNFLKTKRSNKFRIIIRKNHLGLKENCFQAYDFMFSIFDKVIYLEDDILIKKNFLQFMKKNLFLYENNKKVMSITGYSFPFKLPDNYKHDIFFSKRATSWSQASWRRVWKLFKRNKENSLDILLDKKKLKKLLTLGEDFLPMLVQSQLGKIDSFQIWWNWNIAKNNGICINPTKPLVENMGFNSSGTHFKKKIIFNNPEFHYQNNLKNNYKSDLLLKKNINYKKSYRVNFDKSIDYKFVKQFRISLKQKLFYMYLPLKLVIIILTSLNFFIKK